MSVNPLAVMTWQSREVLAIAAVVAAGVGFLAGRWWIIPTIVVLWVVYVEFVYPVTITVIHQDAGFRDLLETLGLLQLFATSVLVGGATAVGFGCREAIHRSRRGWL